MKNASGSSWMTSIMLSAALAAASGCHESTVSGNHITGSGRMVSETRVVQPFSGIAIENFAKVIITQDSSASLRIAADDNVLGLVTSRVANDVLTIDLPEGSYDNVTITVYASMAEIHLLQSTGAADFLSTGPIHTDAIVCNITGAGTVSLSGTAAEETVVISGSGTVRNFDLVSSQCSATISGAGNIEVHAQSELSATISGTGNIVYDGNPPAVHSVVSGVGVVRPR